MDSSIYKRDVFRVMVFSIIAGLFFWLTDAVIDTVIFYREETLLGQLFFNLKFFNIYNRVVVILLFILFGIFFSRILVQRKRAEEALRESEEKFKQMSASAQDAIIMMDNLGKVSFWNESAEKIFGYSTEEIFGKDLHELISSEKYQKQFNYAFEDFKYSGKGKLIGKITELEGVKKDGSVFPAEISMSSVILRGKWNAIGILRDITARKKIEKKLMQTLDNLSKSNAELEQFAYVASHDLQEPLRMISSYVQLLSRRYKDKLGEDANEFIGFAVDGAFRMQTLINDLLSYSRVSTRGKPFEPTNCEKVLDDTMANLKIAIEDSDAKVTNDPLPTINADATQLTQLFQNLIGNAIKFRGEKKPEIHVSAEKNGEEYLFSIKDNGIGIEKDYYDRIFMIFQRLHSRKEYEGTGIGLAVCKRIVERHGGDIWLESGHGRGTTFYFNLPMKGAEIHDDE